MLRRDPLHPPSFASAGGQGAFNTTKLSKYNFSCTNFYFYFQPKNKTFVVLTSISRSLTIPL